MKQRGNQSMPKLCVVLMAGAMVLGVAVPQALAKTDGKSYPGWMCHAQNSTTAKELHYHHKGGITNKSISKTHYVLCPIFHDSIQYSGDPKGINHATIHFADKHPTARLKCTIASRKAESMKLVSAASNQSPVGRASSSFTIYGPKKISSGTNYFIMRCGIPPKTSFGQTILRSYYVEETHK